MRKVSCKRCSLAVCLICFSSVAVACLWDRDTRSMEESEFPDTLDLITGAFPRHSNYFYEWRIKQRLTEIETHPDNLELYDDLAVAYEKTGNTAKAISIAEELESRKPDRYETLANLGTFYIHHGELERGLEYIDKAIKINPDAHFGRERYQKYVVEYVLSKRLDDKTLSLPLDNSERSYPHATGFTSFLFSRVELTGTETTVAALQDAEAAKALKGVLGMMRFGNYDSPVLLECLGDLLLFGQESDGALHLATRAYLKASYESESDASRSAYRRLANMSSSAIMKPDTSDELKLSELEKRFADELKTAEVWMQEVFDEEQRLISTGSNVEQEFERKYFKTPAIAPDPDAAYSNTTMTMTLDEKIDDAERKLVRIFYTVVTITALLMLVMMTFRVWRRRVAKAHISDLQSSEST